MRPTALSLNILVALIASIKFVRVGAFSWSLFWPLALASIPLAYLGGTFDVPGHFYKPFVGVVLIYGGWCAYCDAHQPSRRTQSPPSLMLLLLVGALLGFLSGLVGVGGGIFLSPLLLLFSWADVRVVSGISAAFILFNSAAGLLGVISHSAQIPAPLPYWATAAVAGGLVGAELGSRRLQCAAIKKLLSLVLIIAGGKMFIMI